MTQISPAFPMSKPIDGNIAISRTPQSRNMSDKSPGKLAQVATDFEAVAIGEMLSQIFRPVNTENKMAGGGDDAWKSMLIKAVTAKIISQGGLGLAKPVQEQMAQMQRKRGNDL